MSNDQFSVPSSSWGELVKIIIAYANIKGSAGLDEVAKIAALSKYSVSGNNKFLIEVGILEGGRNKKTTSIGEKFGRALQHRIESDIRKYLKEIIQESEFLSSIITTLRIQEGMDIDEVVKHILYNSGQNDTSKNRAGSRSIVDMLIMSGLIHQENNTLYVSTGEDDSSEADELIEEKLEEADVTEEKVEKKNIIDKKQKTKTKN